MAVNKLNFLFIGTVLFFICSTNGIQGQTSFAQQHTIVKPGDRIRASVAREKTLIGKYDYNKGDSIVIRLDNFHNFETRIVPVDQIIKVEVLKKTHSAPGKKIILCTLIGASAGALFGLLVPQSPTLDHGGFYFWTRSGTAALWSVVGAGSGLIVGIGVAIASPSERWVPAKIAGMPLGYSASTTNFSFCLRIPFGE